MSYDYKTLKKLALKLRQKGVHVSREELVALAPKNDPYYAGMKAQRRDGEWFAKVYEVVGGQAGAHLRRIHYRILDLAEEERQLPLRLTTTLGGVKKTFTHYENHQRCWEWLTEAAKSARYLELIPLDAFVDNRAKEQSFTFNAYWPKPGYWNYEDPTAGYLIANAGWPDYAPPALPALGDLPTALADLPYLLATGYTGVQQRYHLEIWVEKSEGEDVFLPLCNKYNINFVPGIGDFSITTTHRFLERVRRARRPAKLLYISDFDPSGFNMPLAVARKLQYFIDVCGEDIDISLEPVMLTKNQVEQYNLPTLPVKDSDYRKEEWEQAHGGAVELNAMFARDERIIEARRIVEQAILTYYDPTLNERAEHQKRALQATLDGYSTDITSRYQDEWNALAQRYRLILTEWQTTKTEYDRLTASFQKTLNIYEERLAVINETASDIFNRISTDMDNISLIPSLDFPLPELKEVTSNDVLFHSRRNYWQQMRAYFMHRNNGKESPAWLDLLVEMEGNAA